MRAGHYTPIHTERGGSRAVPLGQDAVAHTATTSSPYIDDPLQTRDSEVTQMETCDLRPLSTDAPRSRRASCRRGFLVVLLVAAACIAAGCNHIETKGAIGTFDYEFDKAANDEDVKADFATVRIEGVPGEKGAIVRVGVDGEFLFSDVFSEDHSPSVKASDLLGVEVFPYVGIHPRYGDFWRMPFRLGCFGHNLDMERGALDITWTSIGGKADVAPELILLRSCVHTEELSLFSEFSAFGGWTLERAKIDSEYYDDLKPNLPNSNLFGFGAEVGLKYRYKAIEFRGSYFYREYRFAETDDDPDLYGEEDAPFRINAFEGGFSGVALTVGISF